MGFPGLNFQMVENPPDFESAEHAICVRSSKQQNIANDLGLYFINMVRCKKHTNQAFIDLGNS